MMGLAFVACTSGDNAGMPTAKTDKTVSQKPNQMKNLISIVEISTVDFQRAVSFYQQVLGMSIEKVEMDGMQMGVLPSGGETVNVVLVGSNDHKPSAEGTLVYFNCGDDLQTVLGKIEPNGGKILVQKTEISPDMGFFAIFVDTEGNKIGLHSKN